MRISSVVILFFAISFLPSCGQVMEMQDEERSSKDIKNILIGHPLVGVKLVNGKVPGVDIFNSPVTDNRYAYGEITSNFGYR